MEHPNGSGVNSDYTDQTGWMHRLILVMSVHNIVFVSYWQCSPKSDVEYLIRVCIISFVDRNTSFQFLEIRNRRLKHFKMQIIILLKNSEYTNQMAQNASSNEGCQFIVWKIMHIDVICKQIRPRKGAPLQKGVPDPHLKN